MVCCPRVCSFTAAAAELHITSMPSAYVMSHIGLVAVLKTNGESLIAVGKDTICMRYDR